MPCYKYKVEGRKRNHVEYQPPVSLMTYLDNPDRHGVDENSSAKGNRRLMSTSSSPVRRQQNIGSKAPGL